MIKEISLLLFALLLFLFLASFHDIWMIWPDLVHHVIIVLFFANLERWRKQLDNLLMLVAVGPIWGRVSVLVSRFHIDFLDYEHLNEVSMSLASRNVKTGEALLIFDVWVSSAVEEFLHGFLHVAFCCEHQGCIRTNSFIVGLVYLSLRLKQYINNSGVLCLYGVLLTNKDKIIRVSNAFKRKAICFLTSDRCEHVEEWSDLRGVGFVRWCWCSLHRLHCHAVVQWHRERLHEWWRGRVYHFPPSSLIQSFFDSKIITIH